ncbi:MAG TPA: PadR family transcriptional regulator [Anaerolineaceae bacterium]|nr:PadR family transcriptional regulator [Anaerolineaceae bacterium]HOR84278.1 PadR family transcriptional regulator [Anaerolineaceae bacterium]HPL43818.1 PadR family transcriptional regulator [Anaerolineaceae bacterium]
MSPRAALPLHLEYTLLGLLRQRPQYGYDILQNWDKNLGIIWKVKPGRLYAALNKLEQSGLVSAQLESGENAPARKVFALTPQGEAAFSRWLASPVSSPREFRQEWFAKLFFSSELSPEERGALYANQIDAARAWLRAQNELNLTGSVFEEQVRRFRQMQIQSILDFLVESQNHHLRRN